MLLVEGQVAVAVEVVSLVEVQVDILQEVVGIGVRTCNEEKNEN